MVHVNRIYKLTKAVTERFIPFSCWFLFDFIHEHDLKQRSFWTKKNGLTRKKNEQARGPKFFWIKPLTKFKNLAMRNVMFSKTRSEGFRKMKSGKNKTV